MSLSVRKRSSASQRWRCTTQVWSSVIWSQRCVAQGLAGSVWRNCKITLMAVIVLFLLVRGPQAQATIEKKNDTKSRLCGGEPTICKLLISRGLPTTSLRHWTSSLVQCFMLLIIKKIQYVDVHYFLWHLCPKLRLCFPTNTHAQLTCSVQLHMPAFPFAFLWFAIHNRTFLVSPCVLLSFTWTRLNPQRRRHTWPHRDSTGTPALNRSTSEIKTDSLLRTTSLQRLRMIQPSSRTLTGFSPSLKSTDISIERHPVTAGTSALKQTELLLYEER